MGKISKGYDDERLASNGVVTYQKDNKGNQFWYNSDGVLTHERTYNGFERWYNASGNCIRMTTPTDATEWFDTEGNITLRTRISWDKPKGGKFAKMVNVEKYVENRDYKVPEYFGYNEELYTTKGFTEED